jgi:rare lipoprotein A
VRVTNLRNGRAVVVRINDRGPVVPGRIIDLSYNTARVLQFKSQGLQRVRLDVVRQRKTQPPMVASLRY